MVYSSFLASALASVGEHLGHSFTQVTYLYIPGPIPQNHHGATARDIRDLVRHPSLEVLHIKFQSWQTLGIILISVI